MFRYITASILFVAFAAQTFQRPAMMLGYLINKTAFAKNCENKARPMLHCNGKCQLMKKIREQQKKEQEIPDRKTENKNEVISSRSFFASLPSFSIQNLLTHYPFFSTAELLGQKANVFHPPSVI